MPAEAGQGTQGRRVGVGHIGSSSATSHDFIASSSTYMTNTLPRSPGSGLQAFLPLSQRQPRRPSCTWLSQIPGFNILMIPQTITSLFVCFHMGCGASTSEGITTGSSVDQVQARVEEAQARLQALRARLASLGAAASVELSPAQVCLPPTAKRASFSLAVALQEANTSGTRPPLPIGTHCFVNMVKKDAAHFREVGQAVAALAMLGLRPVPHVPACRFSTADEADATLDALSADGATSLFLPGGNDQQERAAVGAFGSVAAALDAGVLSRGRQPAMGRVVLAGHPDGHPGLG